jgi:RNA polymerase sigma factor (sigma-70 family)
LADNKNIAQEDTLLWMSFKQGNKAAFAKIFKKYYSDLFYYGVKLVSDEDLVKDELQELFADLWNKRQNLSDITHIKAYLIKSFRRKVLKTISNNRKISIVEIDETQEIEFQMSIEDLMIKNEQDNIDLNQLRTSIESLNKTQKEIIYLKFYNDLDYQDIAEITGLKYQSIRNSMHKALKMLRNSF